MPNFLRSCLFAIGVASCLALVPAPVSAQDKPKKASPTVQKEFDAFAIKLRAAMKANDATAVEQLTKFPFLHMSDLRNASEFRSKVYRQLYTAKLRSCVQTKKPVYDVDGEGTEQFLFLCGSTILLAAKTPSGFLLAEVGEGD